MSSKNKRADFYYFYSRSEQEKNAKNRNQRIFHTHLMDLKMIAKISQKKILKNLPKKYKN